MTFKLFKNWRTITVSFLVESRSEQRKNYFFFFFIHSITRSNPKIVSSTNLFRGSRSTRLDSASFHPQQRIIASLSGFEGCNFTGIHGDLAANLAWIIRKSGNGKRKLGVVIRFSKGVERRDRISNESYPRWKGVNTRRWKIAGWPPFLVAGYRAQRNRFHAHDAACNKCSWEEKNRKKREKEEKRRRKGGKKRNPWEELAKRTFDTLCSLLVRTKFDDFPPDFSSRDDIREKIVLEEIRRMKKNSLDFCVSTQGLMYFFT